MKERIRKFIFRVSTLVFALILSIFCIELFIRLNPLFYCQGYKPSQNNKIVYELYPGYTIRSLKAKISSQGLNDHYFPISKPSNIFRIAVVGDSISFGWGVGPENNFPKILECLLNENGYKEFEVINFSAPGYNTSQEFEIIKEKVLKFHPDMVILVYSGNDTHVCNYIQPDITFLNYLYNKSYFVHFALRGVDLLISHRLNCPPIRKGWLVFKKNILGMFYYDQIIYPYPGLEETIYDEEWGNPPVFPKDVPKKYWYMLGYRNYKLHLSNIYNLLKENNILFISCGFFDQAIKINQELGIEYICDFYKAFEGKEISWEKICLSNDGHLNIRSHYLVAKYIYNFFKRENLI